MFAIYACENKYGGLHGMNSFEIIDEEFNIKLAREYGREASRDIINSYSCIHDEIEESARELAENSENSDNENAWEEYYDDEIEEDICYTIYKIKNDNNLTFSELNKLAYEDQDSFIKEYCITVDE